jgi:hypothetical protein
MKLLFLSLFLSCAVHLHSFQGSSIVSRHIFRCAESTQRGDAEKVAVPRRPLKVGSKVETPGTLQDMMKEVGRAIAAAKDSNLPVVRVDIPLPVTGGTELDDWPGGIRQKYVTLLPLLKETMKQLNFSPARIKEEKFIDEIDAVGVWEDNGFQLVCFPTPSTVDYLQDNYSKWNDKSSILALINQQLFLDPMSKQSTKDFLQSAITVYQLEQLNMRGPGALPVRGIAYRQYPGPFLLCRRLDVGGYVLLKEYEGDRMPPRNELEELFMEDSKVRDKDLTLLDRLKKQVPNFGN